MKAAIYCRLSKEDEGKNGESESIQNQKSMLTAYAAEKGFEVYRIYSDEDYSGIDRERPAFNAMIQAASEHKFDVVLAKTQSRFTRDMELVEKYLHGKFIEWGIRFIAVVDHVDTGETANKKSRQINGLINEWYLEDLSNNVRAVLDHKRREGLFIGSFALYGYCKAPDAKGKLVIDPEAAEVVRHIFALALSGMGAHKIAQILNNEGIPSPTAYKQLHGAQYHAAMKKTDYSLWGSPTVYQMLHNQTYIGDLVQGRHKKVGYKSKKTVWLPKSQWIVVENTHEPIIDRDTFETVQRMLAARTRSGVQGTIHPLAKKVVCGCCGKPMVHDKHERKMICPACGNGEYPVLSPAVIVGVTNGDKLILSKYEGRNHTRYAMIAGFAEIGETIEETVHREVMEEIGVKVKNLRYYKSQPWSFSGTLLFGFYCDLDGDDTLTVDHNELSMASWFNREDIPDEGDNISLTKEMMMAFKHGKA